MTMDLSMFVFTKMCIVLISGGGGDCEHQWVVLPYEPLVMKYEELGGTMDNRRLDGFHAQYEKVIYLSEFADVSDILHEIRHVRCYQFYEFTGMNSSTQCFDSHFWYYDD